MSPAQAAQKTGRTQQAVYARRRALQMPDGRAQNMPHSAAAWEPEEDEAVRTLRPQEAAQATGRTLQAVYCRRNELQLPDGRASNGRKPHTP